MITNDVLTLRPWIRGPFLTWYMQTGRTSIALTFALVLLVYWFVPFALSLCYGTAIGANQIDALLVLLGVDSSSSRHTFHGLSYTQDFVHLAFSLLLAVGAAVAYLLLQRIHVKLEQLWCAGVPQLESATFLSIYQTYSNWAFGKSVRLLSLGLAAISIYLFIRSATIQSNVQWWGHSANGPVGFVFSVIVGFMVYWGTRSCLGFLFLSLMLGKLATYPIAFKPFHSDGCNGLKPFGYVAIGLWLFALVLAASIYVVFHYGYLGIETLPGTWLLAFVIGVSAPAIALVPVVRATLSVQKSREAYLANVEREADRLFPFSPRDVEGHLDKIDRIKAIVEYKRILQDENVLPFKPRTIWTMAVATLAQYLLTLKQLFP